MASNKKNKTAASAAAEVASALEEAREDLANDVRSEQREECKEVRNLLKGIGVDTSLAEAARPSGPPQLSLLIPVDQFPRVRQLVAKLIMENDDVMVESAPTPPVEDQ